MIKSELIANIAAKMTNLSETQVADSVNQILNSMTNALTRGDRIEIRGFGSFARRYRRSRNAHNPKTGDKVITKPKYRLHFKPGKTLRDKVDKSRLNYPIQKS